MIVGSIKWAELFDFPPWPAIIDDNPDTKTSVWITGNGEEKVHVVFFNALMGCFTRCWVNKCDLKPFIGTENMSKFKHLQLETQVKEHLKGALKLAREANKLSLNERRRFHCLLQGK